MSGRPFTAADIRTLRRMAAAGSTPREIGDALGRDGKTILGKAERLGVEVKRACVKHRWTPDEDETLRLNYPRFPAFLIAHVLGMSISQVSNRAFQLGLEKAPDFWTQPNARLWNSVEHPNSIASRIKPGATPPNKGTRRPGWAPGRMAQTQFKKGARPHTWKPVGCYRINADGYLDRKVSDTRYPPRDWQPVHRLVWIAANDPVPAGHIVVFKPGRRSTELAAITPDAVECITLAENMRRNTYHRYPKEIGLAIQARGALTRMINRRTRAVAPEGDVP